jgi:hypothetical protein
MLAGLPRYIATDETSKHRSLQFLDASVLPDNMLIAVAVSDALPLGVLSSIVHEAWALAAGGRLGVGNDPRYNKTRCLETFPFPCDDTRLIPALTERIGRLAEQIDAYRKSRQAAHDDVTLTGLHNVLVKLRAEQPLTAKEKTLHEHGLVAVLHSLHDELDAAVLQAYGWADLQAALADHRAPAAEVRAAAVATLLERLVALNAKRAAEEAAGTVRWLRPEFQIRAPAAQAAHGSQAALDVAPDAESAVAMPAAAPLAKRPWPAGLPEQIRAVADVLAASPQPLLLCDLEARFAALGRWRERLPTILDMLAALGRARLLPEGAPRWTAA